MEDIGERIGVKLHDKVLQDMIRVESQPSTSEILLSMTQLLNYLGLIRDKLRLVHSDRDYAHLFWALMLIPQTTYPLIH